VSMVVVRECSKDPLPVLQQRAKTVLKDVFHIKELRNLQTVVIECALRKQSQIVVMATGGGKSLCYQLPAVVLGGITIVVSPLIALMNDQVQALNACGVPAAVLSSAQGEEHNMSIFERALGRTLRAGIPPWEHTSLDPITLL
jgi:ATP-dependent DNA helicase RecQ